MTEILNFALPILSTSRNYGETLSKLAGFAFWESYFLTFFLREIPSIGNTFSSFEANFHLDLNLNVAGALIAVIVALFSRAFALHNLVSNVFGLRRRFDFNNILLPLAEKVGFQPTPTQMSAMKDNRKELMYEVFYKYASSRDENQIAGRHNVEHAMDAWSWFWWPIEASVFVFVAAIGAVAFGGYQIAVIFVGITLLLPLAALFMYPNLRQRAKPQISAIAADDNAKMAILARFNAL